MADVFLIAAVVIAFLILVVTGVYLIVYYSHPDDKNEAWVPKFVVLFGFVLAGGTVLGLPLDVANNEGYAGCDGYDTQFCGGLNMELFWSIIYWAIPIWIFILIPFSTFYYEADDGSLMSGTSVGTKSNSRLFEAAKYQMVVMVIAALIFGLGWLFLNTTDIPVEEYVASGDGGAVFTVTRSTARGNGGVFDPGELMPMQKKADGAVVMSNKDLGEGSIELEVGISTFFAGLLAFLGWFFFALFGGIGVASMPLDFIRHYLNRPRHMDAMEFADAQMSIRERVNALVDIGELMKIEREERESAAADGSDGGGGGIGGWFNREKRLQAREERKTYLQFKAAVYLLEEDVEDFQNCSANYANYNPLIPYISLFIGILASILSIFWILHIILFMLPSQSGGNPVSPFLNSYFQWFDSWFPLFGVLSVALFTFYLLLCSLKGNFKFGLRFLLFTIHPMKVNKTYMSSFMFNIGLILLCALPVVQFSSSAFADYARYSTVRQVFGTQIEYLSFFRLFWTNGIFVYVFLVVCLLTSVYLGCKPRDTSSSSIELRDRLKSRRA